MCIRDRDLMTSLPMLYKFDDVDAAADNLETRLYPCVTEETNQNPIGACKEMLIWHWKLAHPGMEFVKWLMRRGLLGRHSDKIKGIQDLYHPKCESCNYGKQVRSPSRATDTKPKPE